MKRQEKKQRLTLTLFFSTVVFCTLFFTLVLTGLLVYFLAKWGIFIPAGQSEPSYTRIIMLMMGLSLIIGTALTVVIIRIPLSPVNSLISGMRKLSAGDYKARINMGKLLGQNSVAAELAESFNTLASELENTEMLRSDFINNFSHEFKTPIVSIAGFAKLLKRGKLSEEQKEEYLDIIEEESLRLSDMATNVLNLTKIENQTILSNITQFNLSEQLRNCVLMLESKWDKKATELNLDFNEYTITADEELLKQVWINLIDNAVKFSPPGGRVEIKAEEKGSSLCISVLNEGSEIPQESVKRIFTKFYQADESHSGEGNGIGLAIVKRIVDLHGGTIQVNCENGWTCFTVFLPKSRETSSECISKEVKN